MKRLGVVTPDSLTNYISMGYGGWLEEYYNPQHFFDEVYYFSSGEDKERRELGMHIVPVPIHRIWKSIKQFKIDIVRAYGGELACEMACSNKVNGVPVVVSVHDRRLECLSDMIKRTDIAFGVSEEVVQLILAKYKQKDRIWLLPNRVNLSVMKPQDVDSNSDLNRRYPFKFRILHVGRKDPVKNIDTLIRALKILGPEYCLLAIGKGDLSQYTALAKAERVGTRFFSIEAVNNEELPGYYSWASCLCNPSRSEAMSIALIEALACGAVIVTSPIAARGVHIKHLEDGIVFDDLENPQCLASAIERACTDWKLVERLKENARKSAMKFEKSKIDRLEVSYYQKILFMKEEGLFRKTILEEVSDTIMRYSGNKAPRFTPSWVKRNVRILLQGFHHRVKRGANARTA